jgi:6-phosphogluconolactonase (cycloisomerase 2 family)
VIVSPDGKFAFASNRGQGGASSSVTSFTLGVNQNGVKVESMRLVGQATTESAAITSPRAVGLSHDGKVLLVGSQDTSLLLALAVDVEGTFTPLAKAATYRSVSKPTAVQFVGDADLSESIMMLQGGEGELPADFIQL